MSHILPGPTPGSAPPASTTVSARALDAVLGLYKALVTVLARPSSLTGLLEESLTTVVDHLGASGGAVTIWNPGSPAPGFGAWCGCLRPQARDNPGPSPHPTERPASRDLLAALAVEWGEFLAARAGQTLIGATTWLTHRGEYGVACIVGARQLAGEWWRQEALAAAAGLVGHAMERMRLAGEMESRLAQRDARWSSLYEIGVALTREPSNEQLLDVIVRRAVALLQARGGVLSLVDADTRESVVTVAYLDGAPSAAMLGQRSPPGEGLAGEVIARGEPVLASNHHFVGARGPSSATSVMAAPLFVQGACVGVLTVGDRAFERQFAHDDLQTLVLLAQQAGALLERARARQHDDMLTTHRERARLARELHDGLAQNLASLMLKAELCRSLAEHPGAPLAFELDLLADGLQRAVRETRSAIASLHDAASSGERLVDALRLLTSRFQEQSGLAVELTWSGLPDLPLTSAQHMALLRVAQEALTNVRKHARATRVSVHFDASHRKTVALSVQDNGCGFGPESLARAPDDGHYGVVGMRGRIEELGGSLLLETSVGCGVTVRAALPLTQRGGAGNGENPPAARG